MLRETEKKSWEEEMDRRCREKVKVTAKDTHIHCMEDIHYILLCQAGITGGNAIFLQIVNGI